MKQKPKKPNKYVKVTTVEWERGYTIRYEEFNDGKQLYSVSEYTKESIEVLGHSPFLEYADNMLRIRPTEIDRKRIEGCLWEDVFYKRNLPEVTKAEFKAGSFGEGLGKHINTVSKYVSESGVLDLLVFQKG